MDAEPHLIPCERSKTGQRLHPAARLTAALIGEVMIAERDGVSHERIAEILRDLAKDVDDLKEARND